MGGFFVEKFFSVFIRDRGFSEVSLGPVAIDSDFVFSTLLAAYRAAADRRTGSKNASGYDSHS